MGVEYYLNQCNFQTSYTSYLRSHMQIRHEGQRYSCDYCEYRATKLKELERHKQCKHERILIVTGVKKWNICAKEAFHCNVCTNIAKRKHNILAHVQNHISSQSLACCYCEYSLSSRMS